MSHLLLALLLTQAVDSPLKDSTPVIPRPAMVVEAGSIVPFAGVCMDDAQAVHQGKRIAACEASLAKTSDYTMVSTPVLVGGVVAILAIVGGAFAAGYAAAKL